MLVGDMQVADRRILWDGALPIQDEAGKHSLSRLRCMDLITVQRARYITPAHPFHVDVGGCDPEAPGTGAHRLAGI